MATTASRPIADVQFIFGSPESGPSVQAVTLRPLANSAIFDATIRAVMTPKI